jgi:hypothetical protein
MLVALFAAAACGGGAAPLDRAGVATQAETLRSVAAEGAVLAQLHARDDVTGNYLRVHARELADAADALAATIDSRGAGPGARGPAAAVETGARSAARRLERLPEADAGEAGRIARSLERTASRAAEVAGT